MRNRLERRITIACFVIMAILGIFVGTRFLLKQWEREYPYITFQRAYSKKTPLDPSNSLSVIFEDTRENYYDWQPLGTLNHMNLSVNGKDVQRHVFHEHALGTSLACDAGYMPPDVEARYKALLAYLEEHVDISKLRCNKRIWLLLPADYPTFDEFTTEWKRKYVDEWKKRQNRFGFDAEVDKPDEP